MHLRHERRGFTLVELLVGIAIFSMLMVAIATLFMTSLRTARSTEDKVDMTGMARGAVTVMERDLSGAFTSRDFGEYYQFCGTPYGFSLVGIAPGGGLQRTTWVVTKPQWLISPPGVEAHRVVSTEERQDFPPFGEQIPTDTLVLLRFVDDPRLAVEDLDTFYCYWDALGNIIPRTWEYVVSNEGGETAVRFNALQAFLNPPIAENYTAEEQAELYNAVERELWIEMLRGAYRPDDYTDLDSTLSPAYPQFWANLNPDGSKVAGDHRPDFRDYVVAEMITTPEPLASEEWRAARTDGPCFQYVRLLDDASGQELTGFWSTVYNEDRYRAFDAISTGLGERTYGGYDGMLGDPLQPRLPDAVLVNFTFLREGPMVGTPDLRHRMKQMIDVPTAFTRSVP